MLVVLLIIYLISIPAVIQQAKKRRINMGLALIVAILLPFFGLLIVYTRPKLSAGCTWCGNKYNEAIYCGICHKNKNGDLRPGKEEQDFSDRHLVE